MAASYSAPLVGANLSTQTVYREKPATAEETRFRKSTANRILTVLKATYASTLAQMGADLLTLSKLLGHADARITSRHYAHLCDSTLKAAVAKLPSFGHQPETKVQTIR